MVRGFVIFYFYITISQVVRGGVQVNRDEVIEEKGPLFEVDYHSILLSLWSQPKEPYIWQHWIVYSTFDTKIVTNINILPDSFHPHIIIQHLYAQAIIYIS